MSPLPAVPNDGENAAPLSGPFVPSAFHRTARIEVATILARPRVPVWMQQKRADMACERLLGSLAGCNRSFDAMYRDARRKEPV